MPDNSRKDDFERESARLNEGLKSCRAMIDSYRAMIAENENPPDEHDGGDLARYVSTIGAAPDGSNDIPPPIGG